MSTVMMIDQVQETIRVYSRPGCHLCEELIEQLLPLVDGKLGIQVVDIDSNEDLVAALGSRIPVVEFRSKEVCQYHLDVPAIQAILVDLDRS